MQRRVQRATASGATFLGGVLVLSIANVLVKIFGFLYKVPLNRILGDEMANVNAAYSVYSLLYVISTAGIPVAVSVLVSEARSSGRGVTLFRVLRVALAGLATIGALGTAGMLAFARPISVWNSGGDSYLCLIAIAPALLFVCISSVLRGCFQGFGLMAPTAVSGMIEAFGKMALGLLFVRLILSSQTGDGHLAAGYSVFGITLGVALGTLYLFLTYGRYRRRGLLSVEGNETAPMPTREVALRLLRIAVPIALSAGMSGLASLIDGQLMRPLLTAHYADAEQAKAVFSDYSTGAVTLFNMPVVLIYPVASALVPYITSARARGDTEGARLHVSSALRLAALVSLPAALGMSVLARPILSLVFSGDTDMADNAGAPLSLLALSICFLGLFAVTNAVLQAYGRQGKPIISMLVGALCKVSILYSLTPVIGPMAAPLGTLLFYLVALLFNLYFTFRYAVASLDVGRALAMPLVGAVLSVLAAAITYGAASGVLGSVAVLPAILVAAVFYVVLLCLLGAVTYEDIALLPRGARIFAFLRKHRMIKEK